MILTHYLHLRGSVPVPIEGVEHVAIQSTTSEKEDEADPKLNGMLYNPAVFYNRHFTIYIDNSNRWKQLLKSLAPFQWYSPPSYERP